MYWLAHQMRSVHTKVRLRYGALIKITQEYRDILQKEIDLNNMKKPEFYKAFLANNAYVYLGEVVQMPGHIICAGEYDGRVYIGFHDDDFIELTDEEA